MKLAYLTANGLHVRDESGGVRTHESAFGRTVRERHLSLQRRHGWKAEGRGAAFSRGLLWGAPVEDPSDLRIAMTSLTVRPGTGDLLYSLDADGLDAICSVSAADLSEKRLLHGSERKLRYLAASPSGARLACSVGHGDGSASIGVMSPEAADLVEVTEGDSVDLAPSWVPGSEEELVYQSAGIGRARDGSRRKLGPFAVHRLNLSRGDVAMPLESATSDFLGPRLGADGTLYAIRRPYAVREASPAWWRLPLDFVLLPFRLLWAIFQYLNFFSTKYSGKPLTTAGGPKREGADIRQMMVWGNLIDAEQAAKEAAQEEGEPPSIVPRSWELVARRPDGRMQTLAHGVMSFDLGDDGSLIYTTGAAIYRLSPSGERERLVETPGIEQVVVFR